MEAGDRLVKKTGLYWMTMIVRRREPRSLRWWPVIIMVAVVVGYALLISMPARGFLDGAGAPVRIGAAIMVMLLFFGGFMAALYIRSLGPRLLPGLNGEILDERELAIQARAFAMSGTIMTSIAVVGCVWFGVASLIGGWLPRGTDWVYLGFGFQAWAFTLPVLVASWLQPRESAGLED